MGKVRPRPLPLTHSRVLLKSFETLQNEEQPSIKRHGQTDRERQADRQTDRQRERDRQTERQADRQTDRQVTCRSVFMREAPASTR